jgi:hypothetical protein
MGSGKPPVWSRWGDSSSRHRDLFWSLATLAVVAAVFRILDDQLIYRDLNSDESFFVWGGWCITKGLVPYRDFTDYKPPLVFLTHALGLVLYGFAGFRYRWFFVWFPLGSLLALQAALLTRGIHRLLALAWALGLVQLWVNGAFHESALTDAESIGLSYDLLAVACLVARTRVGDRLRVVGGGLLVCCVLSKEPFLPVVLATWVGAFLLDAPRPLRAADAIRYGKLTALGAGAVVGVLCLYLVPTGGMRAYLQMARGYWRLYHDPVASYCALLGRFHHRTALADLWFELRVAHANLLNLRVLGFLTPLLVATAVWLPWRSWPLALTAAGAFLAGCYALTGTHCHWKHDYLLTMAGLFFVLTAGVDALATRFPDRTAQRWVGCALLAAVAIALVPRLIPAVRGYGRHQLGDPYADGDRGVLSFIASHTGPDDRIVTTGLPALYIQTDRLGAIRESFLVDEALGFYEGATDREKLAGLRAELERNRPKVVVLDAGMAIRQARYREALFLPFLEAHGYRTSDRQIWLRPD